MLVIAGSSLGDEKEIRKLECCRRRVVLESALLDISEGLSKNVMEKVKTVR